MSVVIAIIIFSLLIFFHELGHFLLAKKNGIRVVEFSIGFGPRIFSFEKGDTRYSIKLLFFGGSCQMLSGDFFEEDELEQDREHTFESRSVWARIAVVIAGPLFNFILAWIFAVIVMGGAGYDKPVIQQVVEGSPAEKAGLQPGDLIKRFQGEDITLSREISVELYIHPVSEETIEVVYERDGKEYTANVEPEYQETYVMGITYTMRDGVAAAVGDLTKGAPYEKAGGKKGDVITEINGTKIEDSDALNQYLTEYPLTGDVVKLTVQRDGEEVALEVTPQKGSEGYTMGLSYNLFRYETTPAETIRYSFAEMKYQVESVFKSFGMLFRGELGVDAFSGPVGIVDIIGDTYEGAKEEGAWITFLSVANIVILLSANLGVMNLVPIPGVDGGRLVFLLVEAITGKAVPKKFEGVLTAVCLILLMLFALVIMYHDIMRLF